MYSRHFLEGSKSIVFLQTDDEILAAFGADDSEDEKYDEADAAERRRDSTEQGQGQSNRFFSV